ncbi:hypothetical protein H1P_1900012 [Hyella patelloides LEGE 07179]|uniref:Uncharacterized protein n=1 Tax=Hyella patelloides LEGE 07179 TaxID=945734 RepID=A0A563VPD7_9CYAN|nr:hypothetical protein H1P_1900012 [Hyella patelloides LEGE 07179]
MNSFNDKYCDEPSQSVFALLNLKKLIQVTEPSLLESLITDNC